MHDADLPPDPFHLLPGRLSGHDVSAAPEHVSVGKALALIPSTYGLLGWLATLIIMWLDPFRLVVLQTETWVIVIYLLFVFSLSIANSFPRARTVLREHWQIRLQPSDTWKFWLSVSVGGLGLTLYIRDFSRYFGSLGTFISVLLNSSLDIRQAALDVVSLGFTVSYLSWIAVFMGAFLAFRPGTAWLERTAILAITIILFAGNLLFIDRTRPTWIFMIVAFGIMFSRRPDRIALGRIILFSSTIPVAIFFAFALTSGKYDQQSGVLYSFVTYVLGGVAYFDSLISEIGSHPLTFVRTFLPVSKVLEAVGLLSDVPKEILDFRYIPFANNTGTIMQPFYEDGGLPLLLIGLPILCFLTDHVALGAFRCQTMVGRFLWGNLVFSMMIGFFVPKYNTVAFYLFAILYVMDNFALSRSRQRLSSTLVTADMPG